MGLLDVFLVLLDLEEVPLEDLEAELFAALLEVVLLVEADFLAVLVDFFLAEELVDLLAEDPVDFFALVFLAALFFVPPALLLAPVLLEVVDFFVALFLAPLVAFLAPVLFLVVLDFFLATPVLFFALLVFFALLDFLALLDFFAPLVLFLALVEACLGFDEAERLRPEPLFFPPPEVLFTVAHARFSASFSSTPCLP